MPRMVRSPGFEPGSSAWQADVLDQARLRPLIAVQRPNSEGRIINLLLKLKAMGKSELTLKFVSDRLKYLAKHVDLDNPEQVNLWIANKECAGSYKETLAKAYGYYARLYGIQYSKPKFKYEKKLPKIPSKEDIIKVISASPRKYATIFKILMETGIMPFELWKTSRKDIDLDKGLLYVQGHKGHASRTFKLSNETLAMLKEYLQRYREDYPFPNPMWIGRTWRIVRHRIAKKLKDPEIKHIKLYSLRHHYACELYYRTKDILLVKQQLGHKKIETSMIYVQLVNFNEEDEFYSATARNVQEAQKLVENGFEYVCDIEDVKLFRKRK